MMFPGLGDRMEQVLPCMNGRLRHRMTLMQYAPHFGMSYCLWSFFNALGGV